MQAFVLQRDVSRFRRYNSEHLKTEVSFLKCKFLFNWRTLGLDKEECSDYQCKICLRNLRSLVLLLENSFILMFQMYKH